MNSIPARETLNLRGFVLKYLIPLLQLHSILFDVQSRAKKTYRVSNMELNSTILFLLNRTGSANRTGLTD